MFGYSEVEPKLMRGTRGFKNSHRGPGVRKPWSPSNTDKGKKGAPNQYGR